MAKWKSAMGSWLVQPPIVTGMILLVPFHFSFLFLIHLLSAAKLLLTHCLSLPFTKDM